MEERSLNTCADIVFCIDVSGSMAPCIKKVSSVALELSSRIQAELAIVNRSLTNLRVKVLKYRDVSVDADAFEMSDYFTLIADQGVDTQEKEFQDYIDNITVSGGGDLPESTLAAISLAVQTDFVTSGERRRHVIAVFTDAATKALDNAESVKMYDTVDPKLGTIPTSITELNDMWNGINQTVTIEPKAARLVLFVPVDDSYTQIKTFNNVIEQNVTRANGMADLSIDAIVKFLAASIASK